MAETRSRLDIGVCEADPKPPDPELPIPRHAVNGSGRQLSRLLTQPRSVYEALDEPSTPVPEVETAQVDELSRASEEVDLKEGLDPQVGNAQVDALDWDSGKVEEKNGLETFIDHPLSSDDKAKQDVQRTDELEDDWDCDEKNSKRKFSGRRHPGRQDEIPNMTILGRKLGANAQRNRTFERIADLEYSIAHLQKVVSNLSHDVNNSKRNGWILRAERFSLRQRIAELAEYEILRQVQNEAFESQNAALEREMRREMHLLKLQRQQLVSPSVPSTPASQDHGSNSGHDGDTSFNVIQITTLADKVEEEPERSTDQGELKEECSDGQDLSREPEPSNMCSPTQQNDHISIQIVRWPSTLYRSISALTRESGFREKRLEEDAPGTEAQQVEPEMQEHPSSAAAASLDQSSPLGGSLDQSPSIITASLDQSSPSAGSLDRGQNCDGNASDKVQEQAPTSNSGDHEYTSSEIVTHFGQSLSDQVEGKDRSLHHAEKESSHFQDPCIEKTLEERSKREESELEPIESQCSTEPIANTADDVSSIIPAIQACGPSSEAREEFRERAEKGESWNTPREPSNIDRFSSRFSGEQEQDAKISMHIVRWSSKELVSFSFHD